MVELLNLTSVEVYSQINYENQILDYNLKTILNENNSKIVKISFVIFFFKYFDYYWKTPKAVRLIKIMCPNSDKN